MRTFARPRISSERAYVSVCGDASLQMSCQTRCFHEPCGVRWGLVGPREGRCSMVRQESRRDCQAPAPPRLFLQSHGLASHCDVALVVVVLNLAVVLGGVDIFSMASMTLALDSRPCRGRCGCLTVASLPSSPYSYACLSPESSASAANHRRRPPAKVAAHPSSLSTGAHLGNRRCDASSKQRLPHRYVVERISPCMLGPLLPDLNNHHCLAIASRQTLSTC